MNAATYFQIRRQDGVELVTIAQDGNTGIGTTNPDTFKLKVSGTIKAKEVVVELTGWPDYVFEEGYALTPLSEVQQSIQREKHLPGIPSSKEISTEGIHVGQMQAKLLRKIEELTLYVLDLQRQNNELKTRVAQVEIQK